MRRSTEPPSVHSCSHLDAQLTAREKRMRRYGLKAPFSSKSNRAVGYKATRDDALAERKPSSCPCSWHPCQQHVATSKDTLISELEITLVATAGDRCYPFHHLCRILTLHISWSEVPWQPSSRTKARRNQHCIRFGQLFQSTHAYIVPMAIPML